MEGRKEKVGEKAEMLISIVRKSVENILKSMEKVEIFTGAVLPWRKALSVSQHLLGWKGRRK